MLDCVGGETAGRSVATVRDGGRMASIVDLDRVKGERGIEPFWIYGRPDGKRLAELARMIDAGQLAVHLGAVLPLEEAREAQDLVATHHSQGKIVLKVV